MPKRSGHDALKAIEEQERQLKAQKQLLLADLAKREKANHTARCILIGELFLKHGGDKAWLKAVADVQILDPKKRALLDAALT